MIRYMLDTNIIIYTMKNNPPEVRAAFNQHDDQICISSVALMELIYGAEKSSNREKNLQAIEGLAARLEVLNYDDMAANHTGQLRAELAKAGCIIGPYDMMIAGHARSLGLELVSNNEKEFERVPGLRIVNWVK